MKEETRENLTNRNIWLRALNMVLFMIAYGFAQSIIVFVAFFQFVSVLVTGGANLALLKFGKNLSVFIYEILEYQTFNTEIRPFPFSAWPEEDHGGDIWLDESVRNIDEEDIVEKKVEEKAEEKKAEEEITETVIVEPPPEGKPEQK